MVNPYQSPAALDEVIVASEEEHLAATRIRWAVGLLAVGAFCNLVCILVPSLLNAPLAFVCILAGWNVFWLGGLCWLSWRFGPGLLEWAAALLHRFLGGATTLDAWLTVYRESLWPLPIAAVIGFQLWLVWLVLFYGFDLLFGFGMRIGSPLNTAFLIVGHLLGAWVYLTVIAGWVRLRLGL